MPRYNVRQSDPERYKAVKARQDELRSSCRVMVKMSRMCPYCDHRIEVVGKGSHGYAFVKCSNCGEEVIFEPVTFRLSR